MPHVTRGRVLGFLVPTFAGLCFLAAMAFSETPPAPSPGRTSASLKNTKPKRARWHNGPASMPPDTEVVPPHGSSSPPPVRAVTQSVQDERLGTGKASGPSLAGRGTAAALPKPIPTRSEPSDHSFDPATRAQNELNCLRTNSDAREAYYEDLRRTVEEVRTGDKAAADDKQPAPCRP